MPRTKSDALSKNYLILELVSMDVDDSSILKEVQVKPCELPQTLTINNLQYNLRGIIGFSGKRSSVTNVGHYVGYVRRVSDTWEMYDDTKESKMYVSPNVTIPCQILFYTI